MIRTETERTVANLILGKYQFSRHEITTGEWIAIVLHAAKMLQSQLQWFWMFKAISERINGILGQKRVPEWERRGGWRFTPEELMASIDKSGWPENFTRATEVVPLFDYAEGMIKEFTGHILLTKEGQLYVWKWFEEPKKNKYDKPVLNFSALYPLTADKMLEEFCLGAFLPYMVYRNLCFLPRLQFTWMREKTAALGDLAQNMNVGCALIELP